MQIRLLESAADRQRWDAFVEASPNASFFHLSGWQEVIDHCFGHPTFFMFAEQEGQITGVLPLAHVRSIFFGNTLVSLPFCVYGGIAAADEQSADALMRAATALGERLNTDFLELRHTRAIGTLPTVDRYVTFRKPLDQDPEHNMNQIPRKQRAMIRNGAAKGLTTHFTTQTDGFFRAYAESLRNLGTPVLPRRYFTKLQQMFGDRCEVLEVRHQNRIVAGVMSFYFRGEVLPYYGGGTLQAREVHAYDFMYWELLVHALGRGCTSFDFGRSRRGTGSFRFKTHWGFEPVALPYQFQLIRAHQLPNKTPDNPRYAAYIDIWKRLPLPVTTLIGPWLARSLG